MALDGYTLKAITLELKSQLVGGRVNKVLQPEKDEIILVIYANETTYKLLLTCNADRPRIHLSSENKKNPLTPPAFCMTLRKHLTGGYVKDIIQEDMDRIVKIEFEVTNEMFDRETKTLVIEIMGKHSNIILLSKSYNIITANKMVSFDVSSIRQVLAGLKYEKANTQTKLSFTDYAGIRAALEIANGNLSKSLCGSVTGLGFQTSDEIIARSDVSDGSITEESLGRIIDTIKEFNQKLENNDYAPLICGKEFLPFEYITLSGSKTYFDSMNAAVESFYAQKDKNLRFMEHSKSIRTTLKSAISKLEKKIATLNQNILDSQNFEANKISGELVTSNIYRIKKGMKEISVLNYHLDPPTETKLVLDENLSPSENAQRLYKRYSKQKKTYEMSNDYLLTAIEKLEYLQSIMHSFTLCTDIDELSDIKQELTLAKVIQPEKTSKKTAENKPSKPLEFSFNGYKIHVGKNNLQNDNLTKNAKPNDMWLHVLKEHGSHVIIQGDGSEIFPDDVIAYAANLAAKYSTAKDSPKVAVDCTLKKNVKRISKTELGKVTYTNQKTIIANPLDFA